ncbi:MAG: CBS domain-containing protein [bacterium]|nr:CBS domain-containing protein [bacterium]
MSLRKYGICPPVVCRADEMAGRAVDLMIERQCGAVLIVDGDRIEGIFSKHDVLERIAGPRRDPDATLLMDVMTSPVITISDKAKLEDALEVMVHGRFRHLPLVDDDERPVGMLSICPIFGEQIDNLRQACSSLVAYFGAETPGD